MHPLGFLWERELYQKYGLGELDSWDFQLMHNYPYIDANSSEPRAVVVAVVLLEAQRGGLLLVVDLVPHVEVALQAAALGAAVEDAPLDDAVLPARWP